jgi:hypothetical protein
MMTYLNCMSNLGRISIWFSFLFLSRRDVRVFSVHASLVGVTVLGRLTEQGYCIFLVTKLKLKKRFPFTVKSLTPELRKMIKHAIGPYPTGGYRITIIKVFSLKYKPLVRHWNIRYLIKPLFNLINAHTRTHSERDERPRERFEVDWERFAGIKIIDEDVEFVDRLVSS